MPQGPVQLSSLYKRKREKTTKLHTIVKKLVRESNLSPAGDFYLLARAGHQQTWPLFLPNALKIGFNTVNVCNGCY